MERCIFFLVLLLMGREGSCQDEEICSKTAINSCGDCISSGRYCVWCKQPDFTQQGEQDAARCDTRIQLETKGCRPDQIISPVSNVSVVENTPLSESFSQGESIQLSPQEINLKLRPGLPTTFTVRFKRVEGFPVDLYYLMDLSNSMKDDLQNVKDLGQNLFKALNDITQQNAQIGFGAFVDKTVLPFTNTNKDKLQWPCEERDKYCQAAFGYRHVVSITSDSEKFKNEVEKQYISGNLDSPEGSLDAMMQAAVCVPEIGWRNSSTRLIVLTTDDAFHMAGDGKLAGILEPNDEKCHLVNGLYDKSNEMDYPSVGQLATQLDKNNIQPIFAVTKEMATVYTELSKMIPKSVVGVLSNNSDNVVELIKDAYNSLSSKVILKHDDLPEGVKVTYTPICPHPGPAGDTTGVCEKVGVAKEISFNVTVTADSCMEKPSMFYIGPQGIEDRLKVTISTHCDCECNDRPNTTDCSGNGRLTCGTCNCVGGFVGQKCECEIGVKDESAMKASCLKNGSLTECEGRGDCQCGRCLCHNLEQGGGSYHGAHCECDDEHCEKFQNRLCGGNGKCGCGICTCNEGWQGSACHCAKSDTDCRTPGSTSVCSGRGQCECGRCKCESGYQPPFCIECDSCDDSCVTNKDCIECLAYDKGPLKKTCTDKCTSVEHREVTEFTLTKRCKQKDSENCWMFYSIEQLDSEDGKARYRAEVKPIGTRECPVLPNASLIILGSVLGVALIGLLLLALIKGLIYLNDRKEFKKFENEKKKSKWAEADNPLFKNATITTTNPMFTGGE